MLTSTDQKFLSIFSWMFALTTSTQVILLGQFMKILKFNCVLCLLLLCDLWFLDLLWNFVYPNNCVLVMCLGMSSQEDLKFCQKKFIVQFGFLSFLHNFFLVTVKYSIMI